MATLQGGTFTQMANSELSSAGNIRLRFMPEDGVVSLTILSSDAGRYQIALPKGCYVVEGFEAGRRVFSTAPECVVVSGKAQRFDVIISGEAVRGGAVRGGAVRGVIARKWQALAAKMAR